MISSMLLILLTVGLLLRVRKLPVQNLFSGIATESYVDTEITTLIGGAPGALQTLDALAAALNDDSSAASSLTALINANETHIDNVATSDWSG